MMQYFVKIVSGLQLLTIFGRSSTIDLWQGLKCSSEILTNFSYSFKNYHPEVFCKEGVQKNFTKFTGKHLFQTRFNKVAGVRPATFLKTWYWSRYFPVNFVNFLTTVLLKNTSGWLLLVVVLQLHYNK